MSSRLTVAILVTVLAGVVLAGAVLGPAWLGPHDVGEPAIVQIPAGAGAAVAAQRLEQAGVVRSALAVRLLAAWRGDARRLQAGEYLFAGSPRPADVLDTLVAGDVLLHGVTVREGLTVQETLDVLQSAGLAVDGDLAAEMARPELIADLDPGAADLEGYLYPDTYRFPRGVSASVVVREMIGRFREVSDELRDELGEPQDGTRAWVTLASLVEKETGREEERERVAAVFANRLAAGMPLQCDPTVIYALQKEGLDVGESLARRLGFDHAYNTYLHAGLPPGPIANPGAAALRAALRPAQSVELYFVADGNGGHRFSRTLDEHNRAVRQLRRTSGAAERE